MLDVALRGALTSMFFRDDRQVAQVCVALCSRVGVGDLWTADGPGPGAFAVLEGRSPLSSGQQVMVLAAWAFWNAEGGLTLARLLDVLDPKNMRAVADLLVAASQGSGAVDTWLRQYGQPLPLSH